MLDGLEALDIDIAPTHKTLTKAGGKEAVRVLLSKDDNDKVFISRLEYMDKDDIDAIWVLGDGNKNHFPDIKLTRPLRPVGNHFYSNYLKDKPLQSDEHISEESIAKLKDKKLPYTEKNRILLQVLPSADKVNFLGIFPGEGYRQKIQDRYELLCSSSNSKVLNAAAIFELFVNFDKDGHSFLEALDTAIVTTLTESIVEENFAKLLLTILYGNKDVKDTGDLQDGANDRVKLVIDYQPDANVDIYASNANYYKNAISSHLVNLDNQSTNTNTTKDNLLCPIYGNTSTLVEKTFPKIKTNTLLGNITPYARFDNGGSKLTVQRYHRSGTDSYTVDKDFSNKLDSLVNRLTSQENRDKTWRPIASENPDQNDILIAFCHEDSSFPVLKLLTDNDWWKNEELEDYIDSTKEVISLIKAKSIKPNGLTSFIILRKVDTANQKVVFSERHTVSELETATVKWQQATSNVPSFKLPIFIDKKIKYVAPWSLSPEQLVRLSKHTYDRDGELSKAYVPAISFAQTMRLFFEQGSHPETLASQLLYKVCQQTQWLFNFCATHKTLSVLNKSDKLVTDENKNALMYTTLISLLLYKVNRTKELYMKSLSYQLGQFCAAMNELHLGYCESERGGSIPSTLLGSSAYSIALKSPSRALNYLGTRLAPYQTWVRKQKLSKSDDGKYKQNAINQAIFASNWMRSHAEDLNIAFSEQGEKISSTHTAELMLGYLAGREFIGKSENNEEGQDTTRTEPASVS